MNDRLSRRLQRSFLTCGSFADWTSLRLKLVALPAYALVGFFRYQYMVAEKIRVNWKPFVAGVLAVVLLAAPCAWYFWPKDAGKTDDSGEQKIPIATEQAQFRHIKKIFQTHAFLLPWKEVTLRPPQGSTIREISVQVGESVKIGQTLAKADSEAQSLRAELDLIDFEIKNLDFQVTKALAQKNFLSANEVKQRELEHRAQKIRNRLSELETTGSIISPINGVVAEIELKVGDFVDGSSTLYLKVVDTEKMRLSLFLPLSVADKLGVGDVVDIASTQDTGLTLSGFINSIAPSVDPKTGSVQVEVGIEAPGKNTKVGNSVVASFVIEQVPQALAISEQALLEEGGKTFVYRVKNSTSNRDLASIKDSSITVEKVEVKFGIKESGFVQITTGLEEFDQIVRRGQSLVQDGSKVEVVD